LYTPLTDDDRPESGSDPSDGGPRRADDHDVLPARRLVFATVLLLATLLALAAFAALLPAPSSARPVVGIGETHAEVFADRNFQRLRVPVVRTIVPYDAVLRGGWERDEVDRWMAAARAAGIEPLVAFNHSRHAGPAPTVPEYRRHITAFRDRYPWVRLITAWNEPNHSSQPTANDPQLAATFYNQALTVFPDARIVAGDVLDIGNAMTWLRTYRTYVYKRPQLWGIHDYGDANRFRPYATSVTKKLVDYLPGEIWLTETGGIVNLGSAFPFDVDRAARAVQHTFELAEADPRITRVYLYNWYGVANPGIWDSGLVAADGTPRPALDVVRRYLGV
jgi:hypothetical protein